MNDVSKLPKWAQEHIKSLEQEKSQTTVSNCSIEMGTVKHDEQSTEAISKIAGAIHANAVAAQELAKAAGMGYVEQNFEGSGVHLTGKQ